MTITTDTEYRTRDGRIVRVIGTDSDPAAWVLAVDVNDPDTALSIPRDELTCEMAWAPGIRRDGAGAWVSIPA